MNGTENVPRTPARASLNQSVKMPSLNIAVAAADAFRSYRTAGGRRTSPAPRDLPTERERERENVSETPRVL